MECVKIQNYVDIFRASEGKIDSSQISSPPAAPPHSRKRNFSVRYGASIPDSDGRSRRASGSPGTKRIDFDFDFDFEPEKKETQTRSEPKPVSSDLGERNPNRNPNRNRE